jgi:WD40 repeat protein
MARARAASKSEPRPLDVSLTAAEPWPKRPWPPLPMMSRSTEAASIPTTRQTTALRIAGSLVYDDVQSMRTALEALDAHAYREFYDSRLFRIDGVRIAIDHRGELEADCTAFDKGFLALARPARTGSVVVHAGPAISARRYLAGGIAPAVEVPAMPPGVVQRFGELVAPRDEDRKCWSFPHGTWTHDMSWDGSTLRTFDPDHRLIAERPLPGGGGFSISHDGTVALIRSGGLLEIVGPDLKARRSWPATSLTSAALSTDNAFVLLVESEARARVLRVSDGAEQWAVEGGRFRGGLIVGSSLVVLYDQSSGDSISMLDLLTGRRIARHSIDDIESLHAKGDLCVVTTATGIETFDVEGQPRDAIALFGLSSRLVRQAADGAWCADESDARWDGTGVPLHDHLHSVTKMAVAKGRLATFDGDLLVRDQEGHVLQRSRSSSLSSIALRPDGGRLVTIDEGRLSVLDPMTGELWQTAAMGATSIAFLPDGRLVTGHRDGMLRMWSGLDGEPIAGCSTGKRAVNEIVVSPNGSSVLTSSADWRVRRFDTEGLTLRAEVPYTQHAPAAGITDAGAFVACEMKGTVLYQPSGERVARISTLRATSVGTDGERLFVGIGRLIYVVDPATGERRGVLEGHQAPVTAITFVEGRLYTADRRVLVWDVAALRALEWTHPTDEQLVPLH